MENAIQNQPRILFVCGRNQWRSPTAERMYRRDGRVDVRAVGMSSKGKRQISTKDLVWADLVLVMEKKYKSRILTSFRHVVLPPIESLDVPDEYQFMDSELMDLIQAGVEHHIEKLGL